MPTQTLSQTAGATTGTGTWNESDSANILAQIATADSGPLTWTSAAFNQTGTLTLTLSAPTSAPTAASVSVRGKADGDVLGAITLKDASGVTFASRSLASIYGSNGLPYTTRDQNLTLAGITPNLSGSWSLEITANSQIGVGDVAYLDQLIVTVDVPSSGGGGGGGGSSGSSAGNEFAAMMMGGGIP